ncbi:MAG: peptidase D-Ala-D-Ala carboxypeptidase [Myxococcales bacterium]|nr:peptidase D-Ala-D-Ala carboxypeptidase [Myxococcales bacterium]
MMRRTIANVVLVLALLVATAHAKPAAVVKTRAPKPVASTPAPAQPARHDGAHARVSFGQLGVLRQPREAVGRREEPLTAEEDTAKQIEKLLRGPLRTGVTGLFVADARSGEPLFAVNADDPLNPASNVKMISTATALELLGPQFRYPTRLLGPEPDAAGAIRGNVYLLGSWDPTLTTADLDEIAQQLALRGVRRLEGNVIVGADPTRDGIYRAVIPIDVKAGLPGTAPIATAPAGFDLVTFKITAKTAGFVARSRLSFIEETIKDPTGHLRVQVTIAGTIGKGGQTTLSLATKERTADAAFALRAALRAHQIDVTGDVAIAELGDFIGDSVTAGGLPHELGRHESSQLADIIAHVNKWSINWLADRVIMTAAALAHRTTPSMEVALDAMYGWLERHPHLAKNDVLVDTGSGLSYRTRITAHELVSVVRSAAGFGDGDPLLAPNALASHAWLDSLSISGTDGTLSRRFGTADVRGRIRGKTGTLSTVIALSGVLDIDPTRPLAFSIVTNGDRPLSKGYVRRAHEQLVGLLCKYLAKTTKAVAPLQLQPQVQDVHPALPDVHPALTDVQPALPDDLEESEPDSALDAETAGQK